MKWHRKLWNKSRQIYIANVQCIYTNYDYSVVGSILFSQLEHEHWNPKNRFAPISQYLLSSRISSSNAEASSSCSHLGSSTINVWRLGVRLMKLSNMAWLQRFGISSTTFVTRIDIPFFWDVVVTRSTGFVHCSGLRYIPMSSILLYARLMHYGRHLLNQTCEMRNINKIIHGEVFHR